ncbi:hypothetical protein ACA910_012901 [Epithemia clementina (nom. ined.)]
MQVGRSLSNGSNALVSSSTNATTTTKKRIPSPRTGGSSLQPQHQQHHHRNRGGIAAIAPQYSWSPCLIFVGGILTGILLAFSFFSLLLDPFCSRCLLLSPASAASNHKKVAAFLIPNKNTTTEVMLPPTTKVVAARQVPSSTVVPETRRTTMIPLPLLNDGWSMGYFFTGNPDHIVDASTVPNDYFHQVRWFSQLRQDYIVSELLQQKRNGYFVDLAANDAIRISNTFALERYYNWTGLCIEASSIYWAGLAYRKCTLVGAVVGRTRMEEVTFKFSTRKGPQNGIIGVDFDNRQKQQGNIKKSVSTNNNNNNEKQRRSTVTLNEILDTFQAPSVIDYLSLDLEGAEYYALQEFAFDRYQFQVLTIERPSEPLQRLLRQQGYVLLRTLRQWGETLWAHQQSLAEMYHHQNNNSHSTMESILSMEIPKYRERLTDTNNQRVASPKP